MQRYFFGYGSLVHRGTHDHANPAPATLHGWRRAWVATPFRALPYLTAVPAPGHAIDGLIAGVGDDDWAALDRREKNYARLRALNVTHALPASPEIAVYAVPEAAHAAPGPENPILLSYLDVVVQGYADVFGPPGVQHFFDSTDGWTGAVLDDRADPVYPRALATEARLRADTDARVAALGLARIAKADFAIW